MVCQSIQLPDPVLFCTFVSEISVCNNANCIFPIILLQGYPFCTGLELFCEFQGNAFPQKISAGHMKLGFDQSVSIAADLRRQALLNLIISAFFTV